MARKPWRRPRIYTGRAKEIKSELEILKADFFAPPMKGWVDKRTAEEKKQSSYLFKKIEKLEGELSDYICGYCETQMSGNICSHCGWKKKGDNTEKNTSHESSEVNFFKPEPSPVFWRGE